MGLGGDSPACRWLKLYQEVLLSGQQPLGRQWGSRNTPGLGGGDLGFHPASQRSPHLEKGFGAIGRSPILDSEEEVRFL